jgi:hypothetical protein
VELPVLGELGYRRSFVMKRIIPIIALFVFTLALFGAAEAGREGDKTVNLRACTYDGNSICRSGGDVELDGVTVCFRQTGQAEQCGQTEDGEWWFDSLPHGSYWARTEGKPGYTLAGASCTTHPNIPYSPCQVNGDKVHFVISKDPNLFAVNVGFAFVAE